MWLLFLELSRSPSPDFTASGASTPSEPKVTPFWSFDFVGIVSLLLETTDGLIGSSFKLGRLRACRCFLLLYCVSPPSVLLRFRDTVSARSDRVIPVFRFDELDACLHFSWWLLVDLVFPTLVHLDSTCRCRVELPICFICASSFCLYDTNSCFS